MRKRAIERAWKRNHAATAPKTNSRVVKAIGLAGDRGAGRRSFVMPARPTPAPAVLSVTGPSDALNTSRK